MASDKKKSEGNPFDDLLKHLDGPPPQISSPSPSVGAGNDALLNLEENLGGTESGKPLNDESFARIKESILRMSAITGADVAKANAMYP